MKTLSEPLCVSAENRPILSTFRLSNVWSGIRRSSALRTLMSWAGERRKVDFMGFGGIT